LLFRFPLLYHLYTQTVYRKKVITATQKPQQDIYAGHGSFMIFTSAFFQKCPKMDYPVFLFCEEIFLAEKVRSIGGKTTYCPSIKIHDKEHASTGKMKLSKYCKYNFEALTYIIRHFYE
jgi:GT2 family glycosyltransferase